MLMFCFYPCLSFIYLAVFLCISLFLQPSLPFFLHSPSFFYLPFIFSFPLPIFLHFPHFPYFYYYSFFISFLPPISLFIFATFSFLLPQFSFFCSLFISSPYSNAFSVLILPLFFLLLHSYLFPLYPSPFPYLPFVYFHLFPPLLFPLSLLFSTISFFPSASLPLSSILHLPSPPLFQSDFFLQNSV